MPAALKVAFRTGGVAGMFTVGLGLLGATVIIMIFQNTARRSSSGSASAARCSPCSCGSAAASSPRRPTSAPTSSARSRPASPRTTPATRPRSPTTSATTSATAPAWRPTCSSRYEVTLVASIILGVSAFQSIYPGRPEQVGDRARLPARLPAPSACSRRSSACSRCGRPTRTSRRWRRSTAASSPPASSPSSARSSFALVYVGNHDGRRSRTSAGACSARSSVGLVLAQVVSRHHRVLHLDRDQARCRRSPSRPRTGARPPRCSRASASGLESSVWAIVAIAGRASAPRSRSAAATSSSRSTSSPSPAWACSPRPASSCRRTRSARSPTTRPASPRCRASSRARPSASW